MLGLSPSQNRGKEEIPEALLAGIPLVSGSRAETTFSIEDEEVIEMGAGAMGAPHAMDAHVDGAPVSPVAQQLRYELGEAFARELDRAERSIADSLANMEKRLKDAETALAQAQADAARERSARETAEARLKAFKDLALR